MFVAFKTDSGYELDSKTFAVYLAVKESFAEILPSKDDFMTAVSEGINEAVGESLPFSLYKDELLNAIYDGVYKAHKGLIKK